MVVLEFAIANFKVRLKGIFKNNRTLRTSVLKEGRGLEMGVEETEGIFSSRTRGPDNGSESIGMWNAGGW
jgi:hypothetical protein